MKKLLAIIGLAALALAAQAQLTNGVKISALGTATTPLAGSEIIPLVQSGTTKTATVTQVLKAATDSATSAQTYASGLSNILGALAFTSTTTLAKVTDAGNLARSNNIILANVTDAGTLARSNVVLLANVADAGSAAASNASAFYLSSNPSNYQNAAQVASTVNSAVSAATFGAATNGGTVTFSKVISTNVVTPSANLGNYSYSGATNIAVDFTAGSFQQITLTPSTGGIATGFRVTNCVDGQQVTLLVNRLATSINYTPNLTTPPGYKMAGSSSSFNTGSGVLLYLNWIVVGTNIIYSGSTL
jgi:hypothetical protein